MSALHKLFAITRTVTHSAKRLMFRLNYGDNFKQNAVYLFGTAKPDLVTTSIKQ